MPYMREGVCVYHENEDGSRGELIKCHDTVEEAERHMRALYANVADARKGESDENKPVSEDVQACVSRRVANYIEDGMEREAALARAYAECREEYGDKALPLAEIGGDIYAPLDCNCKEPVWTKASLLPDRLIAFGGGIKKLGNGRVGGYLVMWGDERQRDLQGEYFSKDTDLGLDWFPRRPVLYHHGLDSTLRHTRVGEITSLEPDEVGVWAEAQLDLRNRYVEAIMQLVEKGAVGWSSGTLPHLVQVETGKIAVWPIVEGSITPTPAEPRLMVIPLKALQTLPTPEGFTTKGLGSSTGAEAITEGTVAVPPSASTQPAGNSGAPHSPDNRLVRREQPFASGGAGLKLDSRGDNMDPKEVALAAVNATLQALGKTDVSDEDKSRLVESILAHLQNTQQPDAGKPAGTMTTGGISEEAAHQLGALIGKAAIEVVSNFISQRAALDAARAQAQKAAETIQPESPIKGGFNNTPRIEVRTRYHNLSAEDMAFLWTLRNGGRKAWTPPQEFVRELADKVVRDEKQGKFEYLEVDPRDNQPYALKAIHQIVKLDGLKSNEVMGTAQSGYGADWVPDLWSNELWRKVRMENKVLSLLNVVDMPQDDYKLPVSGADPTVYRVPETTNDAQFDPSASPVTASKMGTTNKTLSAKKIGARVPFSAEEDEDSIIPFVPELRAQMLAAMEDAIEYCVLHADATTGESPSGNINLYDAAVNASDTYRWLLGFDGIAHLPLVDDTDLLVDQAAAAPDVTMLRTMRKKLDTQYMARLGDLAYIVDPLTGTTLLDIDHVMTLDKFGPKATLLTGQLAAIDNIPIIASDQLALADDNGKISNTSANNVYGRCLLIYRPAFRFGYRRRVSVEVVRFALADASQIISYARIAFVRRDDTCASMAIEILV